jgi:putative transposase
MPRPPRAQVPGGIYHLGARGVRRSTIYRNTGDYELFGSIFKRVVRRFEWRCHTYCLMPNHYHLLVETPTPNLSAGMQRLNSVYAQWFNDLYGCAGHAFERRFYSRLVESEDDLLELTRYIVLNPVRAGICDDPAEWRWSSYRALSGAAPGAAFLTTDWLLAQFAPEPQHAHAGFQTFIREAMPHGEGSRPRL